MYDQGLSVWWVLMNCKEHLLLVGSNFFSILNTEVGYHTVEWVSFFFSSPWHFFRPVPTSYRLNSHDEREVSKCVQNQFSFVWCQMLLREMRFCMTEEFWCAKSGELHKVFCQKCQSAVLPDAHGLLDALMWPVWKMAISQKQAFNVCLFSRTTRSWASWLQGVAFRYGPRVKDVSQSKALPFLPPLFLGGPKADDYTLNWILKIIKNCMPVSLQH